MSPAGSDVPTRPRKTARWSSHLGRFSTNELDDGAERGPPRSPNSTSSNSTIRDRVASTVKSQQRRHTVTVNESFSRDDVVLNLDLVGDEEIRAGNLVALDVLENDKTTLRDSGMGGVAAQLRLSDAEKRYIFRVKDMAREAKTRYPTVEVYVAKHIADAFGMKKGSQVILTRMSADNVAVEASHVELLFKDMYLSRADVWRMTVGELAERTVFPGQSVLFMGTIKVQVASVYVDGKKVQSAFFGRNTKPIFRSETARYVLFVQMAREMWDFDSDGSGEIVFSKVVHGFLPALFKKWALLGVKHLVTIVLFARVEYDVGISTDLASVGVKNDYYTGMQSAGERRPYKDFYRVVVSEMASGEWTMILYQLKREFNHFRRDISTFHLKAMRWSCMAEKTGTTATSNRIAPQSSRAIYGNVLEAINMASSLYAHDCVDRDLMRTGISIVVITPSSGVFEVDYDVLRRTTDALVGNGIGIDLICISKIPLHSVPLFRYRNPQYTRRPPSHARSAVNLSHGSTPRQASSAFGSYQSMESFLSPSNGTEAMRGELTAARMSREEWAFALPQWLHISFWTGSLEEALSYEGIALSVSNAARDEAADDFTIRCRMYDLQMRSVMETNEINTRPLHTDPHFPQETLHPSNLSKLLQRQDTILGTRPLRVPEQLFDHVYGFLKFAPGQCAKAGEKTVWKQLQEYDDARTCLPCRRMALSFPRQTRDATDTPKQQSTDEAGLRGSSFGLSNRPPHSHAHVTNRGKAPGLGHPVRPLIKMRGSEQLSRNRRDSDADSVASAMSGKKPKLMKQINLGVRGFGIAAPQVVSAELSTETARVEPLTPARPQFDGKEPKSSLLRPQSPQSSQSSSSGTKVHTALTDELTRMSMAPSMSETESRVGPIRIKSTLGALERTASKLSSRSILASTLRGEAGVALNDPEVKHSDAIRKEDAQKELEHSKFLALAGDLPELPSTLSPTTALAPWLTLLNPSNPDRSRIDAAVLYNRWQHVFPRLSEMRGMKWKSICCPATVPLTTEYSPSKAQIESEYQRQPYRVSPNNDDEMSEELGSRDELLRELISMRFSQGFQIVVGDAVAKAFGQKQLRLADVFACEEAVENGTHVVMSVGNTIHQLSCVNDTDVEVNIYRRKPVASSKGTFSDYDTYKPAMRTLMDRKYETGEFDLCSPKQERNWNYIDSFIAGHDVALTESLRFWRTRFVLIPMATKHGSIAQQNQGLAFEGDNEEELRIEGIRKLALLWRKNRYVPRDERRFQNAGKRRKGGLNSLDIVYKTDDPSVVIAAELETLPLVESTDPNRKKHLVTSNDMFKKKNFGVAALAEAIQQPVESGGLRMQNRRWHLRMHYNCFIGSDMTSWLLDNFEDLEDREEAEAFGNKLMVDEKQREKEKEKEGGTDTKREAGGLFVHVERRHPFRDGQYFYQITSEYAKPPPPGWFNNKSQLSGPSLLLAEQPPRSSPRPSRTMSVAEETTPTSGSTTPTVSGAAGSKRPKVALSRMMKYDVDYRKNSYRPEIVELHYDRLHNPENCYHIRVEWMNVTAKLIEDAVERWAQEVAPHGLRLVEVPIAEACSIARTNPFRRPYVIRLAAQPPPPDMQHPSWYEGSSPAPHLIKHFFQKAILRKHDFVLDVEAASNFPSNVDVSYSWGKPDFRYTQYIHRSGMLLAEITDEGDILTLANRMYSNRATAVREREMARGMHKDQSTQDRAGGVRVFSYGGGARSPASSPLMKPSLASTAAVASPLVRAAAAAATATSTSAPSLAGTHPPSKTGRFTGPVPSSQVNHLSGPGAVLEELESFLRDGPALEAFYKEQIKLPRPTATPTSALAPLTVLTQGTLPPEGNIPALGLPPGVLGEMGESQSAARVGSPAASGLFFRRGSVQEGILGLAGRLGGGVGGNQT